MPQPRRVEFTSEGETIAADLYLPDGVEGPLPIVVMAGGWCYVKELVQPHYAEAFVRVGCAALVFDYRRFGASDGTPRQHLDPWDQIEDYRNAISYAKTALWLNTLERRLGWETLQRIMASYFSRWQFNHPKPSDFFDTASAVAGHDLGWFFDQVYRSSNVFDYGVQELQSTNEGGSFRTSAVVRRYGEGIFPVSVRVTFANGEHVDQEWDGRDRWKLYTYDRPSRAVSAQVDPDRVLLLDVNSTNNSRTLAPRAPRAATKWSLKWMVWLQDLLLNWAILA